MIAIIVIFFGDLLKEDGIGQSNLSKCPIMKSFTVCQIINELTTS